MRLPLGSLLDLAASARLRATLGAIFCAVFALTALTAAACSKQAPPSPAVNEPATPPSDPAAQPPSQPAPGDAGSALDAGALDPKPSGEALADCDTSKVRCRRMPPQCAEGQVATVSGSCFGECVAVERCACSASVACPQSDKYTCWQGTHCGPYVR